MEKSAYYKKLFFIGGMWNIVIAVPAWIGMIFQPEFASGLFGMTPPTILYPYHAMLWFVISFGVGYLIVSKDITKNHGIVVIGILAKTLYFIDCVITLSLKQANVLLLLIGIGDLIFAGLFWEFLYTARKEQQIV